jgi:hypothetical protein
MGLSVAVVYTINVPTGSRKKTLLRNKNTLFCIYLMLSCLPLFVSFLFADGSEEEMN